MSWTILTMSLLLFLALNMPVTLLSIQCQKALGFHKKYLKRVIRSLYLTCIWCNVMSLCGLRFKKHIFHIIVTPLCSAFLKRVDLYKAHCSEKQGMLWLAHYPVRCDWMNVTPPHRIVMLCPDETKTIKITNEAFVASSENIITDYKDSYGLFTRCTPRRINTTR